MEKVIEVLKKPARLIVLICLLAFAGFQSIYMIGVMSNSGGNAGAIVGSLFYLLVLFALVGSFVVAFFLKKDLAMKTIGVLLLGYQVIGEALSIGDSFDFGGAFGTLRLIALLSLILSMVIFFLGLFLDKFKGGMILKILGLAGVATYVLFAFIAWCVMFGSIPNYDGAWIMVMYILAQLSILPAVLFGYILLGLPAKE